MSFTTGSTLQEIYTNSTESSNITDDYQQSDPSEPVNYEVQDLMLKLNRFGYFIVPLLFVLGIGGNAMTVFIMCTKAFRQLPVSSFIYISCD